MFFKRHYQKLQTIARSFTNPNINTSQIQRKLYSVNTSKDKNKKETIYLKPKKYSDVNLSREKVYYEYERMNLETGVHDDYEITRKLGQGRYSVVYEGYNVVTDEKVVVKILKPVKIKRIKREVKILQNLKDGPNIVKMIDFIVDHGSKTPSIVYEYLDVVDWRELYPKLTDLEIRYYMYQILKSLNYTHSMGIIHRDIKPHNIIIKPSTMELKLIDWGLAEFYFPGQEYSVRVASRFFKGPELLLNNTKYDYSLDIWSLGCILASIVFSKEPFFYGQDNFDQLAKIVRVMGTKDMNDYIGKYNLNTADLPLVSIGNHPKKQFQKFVNLNNSHLCSPDCLDLLSKMLVFDHANRITPEEALLHPYFNPAKEKFLDKL